MVEFSKINGSKAAVALGWFERPNMESYWDEFRPKPQAEAKTTCKLLKWGTFLDVMALVTVLKGPLFSLSLI